MSVDPETLYPPRPGGMVESARAQAAAESDQLQKILDYLPEPKVKIDVPVMDRGAEFARARTFSIATGANNSTIELLGEDIDRKYAVLMTLDEPIVISFSEQAADDPRNAVNAAGLSANGFVLPVNVAIPVSYKGVIWGVATSSTPTMKEMI